MDMIVLDHGSGGKLSYDLINEVIIPELKEVYKGTMEDSTLLDLPKGKIAITTDSFVLTPIFLKNADIGKLSVCGTVNDLISSGAVPKYITLSFILEEGFPINDLKRILKSIKNSCIEAGVYIVTGDTKVVEKGNIDKIAINTTGIGIIENYLSPNQIMEGDDVIVSSFLGNHSIHVLSMREGLGFENNVLSDCAPLANSILKLLKKHHKSINCVRDITRGGLASIVNEIAIEINKTVIFDQGKIPIQHETIMASSMLGINPLYLANEGCLCIFCNANESKNILKYMRNLKYFENAAVCGKVLSKQKHAVLLKDSDGEIRQLEFLKGKVLPRLC